MTQIQAALHEFSYFCASKIIQKSMNAYFNGRIFNGERFLTNACILTDNHTIIGIVADNKIPSHAQSIDLQGNIMAPAFIDLQIYGGNGALFGEFPTVEALAATYQYCLAGGAAHFMPTVATHAEKVMFQAIDAVRCYQKQGGKGVLGLHLEGPFINMKKRGAHLKAFVQEYPSVETVENLLKYGGGVIKMMTLAPEVVSDAVIALLQKQQVTLSIGHTNATFAAAKAAFSKGISVATHLFNAMSPFQHRAMGVVGAIYDDSNICTSIVADGYHVDFQAIRISKTILKERLFLITDAVTENLKGHYNHRLDGDKYVISDGTLSGSALTMLKAVRNCVEKVGISLEESLRMASLYPARVLDLQHQFGRIEVGFSADFVVFNDDWQVQIV
jgi:N-acetylglucosamine-6-phosphate deacetylase